MSNHDFPEGCALVERAGWEQNEEGVERFTALLVFPNGPPDMTMAVIFQSIPVRIEVAKAREGAPS